MAGGAGFIDAEGIYQFGEDDSDTLMSDLLNRLAEAVSTQINLDRLRLSALEDATEVNNATISLSIGTVPSGFAAPQIHRVGKIVTIFGRIANGSGLTLSTSFQTVATLPVWGRPADKIGAPAQAGGTSSNALVQVNPDGTLQVASSSTLIGFAFSYAVP